MHTVIVPQSINNLRYLFLFLFWFTNIKPSTVNISIDLTLYREVEKPWSALIGKSETLNFGTVLRLYTQFFFSLAFRVHWNEVMIQMNFHATFDRKSGRFVCDARVFKADKLKLILEQLECFGFSQHWTFLSAPYIISCQCLVEYDKVG